MCLYHDNVYFIGMCHGNIGWIGQRSHVKNVIFLNIWNLLLHMMNDNNQTLYQNAYRDVTKISAYLYLLWLIKFEESIFWDQKRVTWPHPSELHNPKTNFFDY